MPLKYTSYEDDHWFYWAERYICIGDYVSITVKTFCLFRSTWRRVAYKKQPYYRSTREFCLSARIEQSVWSIYPASQLPH